MEYKQFVAIMQLLEACGQTLNVENIQNIAECMGIDVNDEEIKYLIAIVAVSHH